MLAALREWSDRLLGRGSAAITVPVMDGALKANRVLDQTETVATVDGLDDLASDGRTLWASAGATLLRVDGGACTEALRCDAPITAIAAHPAGRLSLALDGREIRLLEPDAGAGFRELARLGRLDDRPLRAVNSLAFDGDRLLFSDGSAEHGPGDWCRDLMTLGSSGRVGRWDASAGTAQTLAQGLRHAWGVLAHCGQVLASESWQHRVVRVGAGETQALLARLPAYTSRMASAAGGGFWLSCFACRTQLVEFVLREPAYRRRMLAEIDPRYWIAPALASGQSFLEPLQGAGVKQMGVLKPWAPPRSYGLVLRVGDDGHVIESLHSQVDGHHHGITAVAEHRGALYAVAKGSASLLRLARPTP